ncbi:ABC transporter substrate-binding protein [Arthrobacter psychrolactophilus]|uniref:ABC transporter substrate-binding protein n=1 Tax=Arthrobacter psychrolactophilus TaxID=92442 RepID=A0A2V5IK57_9MICC|nr:ABC transporter substrate-binding protein [Arthrobacter psychrolactophilus]PYI37049.1 ABC transporter substrate-binding protein [Arthrobacter psychrolactophilus]
MNSIREKISLAVAATAVAMMALTGCGSGTASTGGGAMLPDEQQNLTFVPAFAVPGLDPTKAPLEMGSNQVLSNVLQALVKLDENSQPQPQLAESWEWTTPTTLTLKLREGVTFSDGQALSSADVKATLERYISQKQTLAAVLAVIESVSADDPTTVTITTTQPTGTLLGVLSMLFIGQAAHAQDDAWWAKPTGTGPFVINDFIANDKVSLTRNEGYWGEKAKLRSLTFKLITDVNAKVTALSNGQAQVLNDVPFDQVATVEAMSNVAFTQTEGLTYNFLWFNNAREPFTDVRVRTAMWEAVDLPTIVESLYGDTASVMDSFCPTSAFGCVAATDMPSYDPEHAKKLLAEAGYAEGFTADVIFSTANAGYDSLISALVSAWNEIGVTITPRALDGATWLSEFSALNWDMDVQPNQTATGDADYTLNRLYKCEAKRMGYCNPELDQLMAQAQESNDAQARLKLYQQVVDTMVKDAPAIPLFQTKPNVAASNTVQGLTIPPTEFIDWSTVYLTE